ncbi:Pumilio-like protein [Thalictrum thalictroides]|uniref:Pumilio-like protein n=1 Tax=Thalictrum thalictroides TaxID=46969 RepID=A0A7J6V9V6_THATH|nr:Pumilio-like protein [Thalictrum thalictroides]
MGGKRKNGEEENNNAPNLIENVVFKQRLVLLFCDFLELLELAEARKKKRKRHYTLEQELASLWERMRCRNIAKEDRSKLVSEAIQKVMGKICEIAVSHVSSRVLQLEGFISSLHGHVAPLLRHMVGSVVIEHTYQLGNPFQKQSLLLELYSAEVQLFKDLVTMKERRLEDLIPKLALNKGSVVRHMASVIQSILEKGIVDHSIIHTALIEYLNIADKSSATDILEQLSGPLLVRMIHTKDGSKLGMLCIKHGGAKERKKIIKGMKGHIEKIALDQYGCMIVLRELQPVLKELVFNMNGRRPLLQLLNPNCQRYLGSEDLAALNLSVQGEETEVALDLEKEKKYFRSW